MRGWLCRNSTTDLAIETPSYVLVPLPISSRTIKLSGVRPAEDRRKLGHFDQERAFSGGDVIAGPDASKDSVNYRKPRRLRRHKAARLRHESYQRNLAQKRRLAGHVGAGQNHYVRFAGTQMAVVGDESLCLDSLDDGMSPLSYVKSIVVGEFWTDVAPLDRDIRDGRGNVQPGYCLGGAAKAIGIGLDILH